MNRSHVQQFETFEKLFDDMYEALVKGGHLPEGRPEFYEEFNNRQIFANGYNEWVKDVYRLSDEEYRVRGKYLHYLNKSDFSDYLKYKADQIYKQTKDFIKAERERQNENDGFVPAIASYSNILKEVDEEISGKLSTQETQTNSNKILQLGNETKFDLKSIFNPSNNSFEICEALFKELEITIDGQPNLKSGRVGKLTGLIIAIKTSPGMLKLDSATEEQLLKYFNSHLGSSYVTFSKRNSDFEPSKDEAIRYIKLHLQKVTSEGKK